MFTYCRYVCVCLFICTVCWCGTGLQVIPGPDLVPDRGPIPVPVEGDDHTHDHIPDLTPEGLPLHL